MAENPLLLTLLIVMQQNSIVLPRQRVELYDVVTRTLLENRNIVKKIEPIPEIQAVQRLGPLAFQMQEANNSFTRQRDVMEKLTEAIRGLEGGTDEEVQAEAQRFLERIRERGGLFVLRAGDYFSFMHRTFQEYFAARYILNQMKKERQRWINELVERASRRDALWREPFLLAVGYQSKENEQVANEILKALLARVPDNAPQEYVPQILLAAEAVIEARPLTIDGDIEKRIAEQLLASYERAQRARAFEICKQIEDMMLHWLLNLPKEAYRLPLLAIISQSINDAQHAERQRATLTLLAMIADKLEPCASAVFETIIPPLLALTGLPGVGPYSPKHNLSPYVDFDVADLAVTVLSFMGKRGPAGYYLATLRSHFREHPEQLATLARCSLECGTLITPTLVPPRNAGNYPHYETAIRQWIQLRDRLHRRNGHITPQEIADCATIHQMLLERAQEASYPTAIHLLAMLQRTLEDAEQPWSQVWQTYLLEQVNTGPYVHYQQVALLWNALFPAEQQLQPITASIREHYMNESDMRNQYAQRCDTALCVHSRDLIYYSNFIGFRGLSELRYLSYLRDYSDLIVLICFRHFDNLRYIIDFRGLRCLSYFRYLNYLRDLRGLSCFRYFRYLSYLSYLRDLLITHNVAEKAYASLVSAEKRQKIEALTILMGYLLQIQERKQTGDAVEMEDRQFAHAAIKELSAPDSDGEIREAALDVLRSLPARTSGEIVLVRQLAEKTHDENVRKACLLALRYAQPVDDEGWHEIEQGCTSPIQEIKEASVKVMERAKK